MTITFAAGRLTIGGVEYAIVPVEPADRMVIALMTLAERRAFEDRADFSGASRVIRDYGRALAAAPALPPDAERALRVAFGEGNGATSRDTIASLTAGGIGISDAPCHPDDQGNEVRRAVDGFELVPEKEWNELYDRLDYGRRKGFLDEESEALLSAFDAAYHAIRALADGEQGKD